jgi:hypothetical protein
MRRIETALLAASALGIAATAAVTANATPLSYSRQLDSAMAQNGTIEKAAYVFAGHDYCFYPDGWHGPGFYRCGYSWRRGLGWGGPIGWHGWRAGRGEVYAGHGHGYVGRSGIEGRMGGPNGRAEVRGGGFQRNSQVNAPAGRTLQNNAAGMGGHAIQNNARGMGAGTTGARGGMSRQGGAMGAHGGAGGGGAGAGGAPAAHTGGHGSEH